MEKAPDLVGHALDTFQLIGDLHGVPILLGLARLGQITAFSIYGCRVRSPVYWPITAQSSLSGRMRGSGLIDAEVRALMVATWFAMSSCPWRHRSQVLYICTCSTVGSPFRFGLLHGHWLRFIWDDVGCALG